MCAAVLVAGVVVAGPAASQVVPSQGRSLPAAAVTGPTAPAQWPDVGSASFGIDGWSNAVRVFGGDSLQNSAAAALLGRGSGRFPFGSPDRTGGASSLAGTAHWWGLGVCPKSVIVVAGDVLADAMAASALSDPTGGSSEPWLRRIAAADPLFDPIGGFARVDTFAAPILFVGSARGGATALPLSTRLVAADLRSGGCRSARQAVIVGGPAAVPVEVEAELVADGYAEVFRVAGRDRYATAAAVAQALGTAAVPAGTDGCTDSGSFGPDDLSFYANAVVEYRSQPGRCELLGRTVVLADGVEGIDAVAAGWWTSRWQVPVLLHNGSGRLPQPTVEALSILQVDHIVVLGGEARVSASVVRAAERVARARAIRVAGPNRYSTSVEMARHFGGWFADEEPGGYAGALVCVAASSGTGAAAVGWADALTAGPWCGTASARATSPPTRIIGSITVPKPAVVGLDSRSSRSVAAASGQGSPRATAPAVPVLLLPAGGTELPPSLGQYLKALFRVPASCAALVGAGAAGSQQDAAAYAAALRSGTCPEPGFAVAFGGSDVLADETVGALSAMLSGGLTSSWAPQPVLVGVETPDPSGTYGISTTRGVPLGAGVFATTLPMSPVYRHADTAAASAITLSAAGLSKAVPLRVCAPRGSYGQARWLIAETAADQSPLTVVDLPDVGWYLADADGTLRSSGRGTPSCLSTAAPTDSSLLTRAVSSVGRTSRSLLVAANPTRRMSLTGPVYARWPETSGVRSDRKLDVGVTTWEFSTDPPDVTAQLADARASVTATWLKVSLRRRAPAEGGSIGRPVAFTADWSVQTERGQLSGTASGEALLVAGRWELRGATVLRGGSWASSLLGAPGRAADPAGSPNVAGAAAGPRQSSDTTDIVTPLRAGTADGYGAGGFTATINTNGADNNDDTIRWQPEAFINTPHR